MNELWFYVVIGQISGHVVSDCFDVPLVIYDGRAQTVCVKIDGCACSNIVQYSYSKGVPCINGT
jgi:DNA relaxase NicK